MLRGSQYLSISTILLIPLIDFVQLDRNGEKKSLHTVDIYKISSIFPPKKESKKVSPECVIVRTSCVLRGVHLVCPLVIGIVGHEVAAVHVGAQDEGVLHDQLHHGLGLGLDLENEIKFS